MTTNGIHRFEHLRDFIAACEEIQRDRPKAIAHMEWDKDWRGNTFAGALTLARVGSDASKTKRVTNLIDDIERQTPLSSAAMRWGTDLVGYIPHVPNVVMGLPDAMMRPQFDGHQTAAPIRIYVDTATSAGISETQKFEHGAAVAAFVYMLKAARPVELFLYCSIGKGDRRLCMPVIRIDVDTMDVARLTYCMTSTSFYRSLCFGFSYDRLGVDVVNWAWNLPPQAQTKRLREVFEMSEEDVLINGFYLHDRNMSVHDWIRRELGRHAPELLLAA